MTRVRWECRPDCAVCAESRARRPRRDPLPVWAVALLLLVSAAVGFARPLWDAMPWAVSP